MESDPSLVKNVKIGVQEFLNLPVEEKKKIWQTPDDIEGFSQLFVVSENQKLEWADLFFITTLPSYARNPPLISKYSPTIQVLYFYLLIFCFLATMLSIADR